MKRTYQKPEVEFSVIGVPSILGASEETPVRFDGEKVDIFSGEILEGNAAEAASRCDRGGFWDDEL